MPSTPTTDQLRSVLSTLTTGLLPSYCEIDVTSDAVANSYRIQIVDRFADLYATAELERQAVYAARDNVSSLVQWIDHMVRDLLERLATSRMQSVAREFGRQLVDERLWDVTTVSYNQEAGRWHLTHTDGATIDWTPAEVPGGLPGWVREGIRQYRIRVQSHAMPSPYATTASMGSSLHNLYREPTEPRSAEDYAEGLIRHRVREGLGPTPLDNLTLHAMVAQQLVSEAWSEGDAAQADALRHYQHSCQRMLRSVPCDHEWGVSRWDGRNDYTEECSLCGTVQRGHHNHADNAPYTLVQGYGEVDLNCQGCEADAAKVPAVWAVFASSYPSRFERVLEVGEPVKAKRAKPAKGSRFDQVLEV